MMICQFLCLCWLILTAGQVNNEEGLSLDSENYYWQLRHLAQRKCENVSAKVNVASSHS